MVLGGVKNFSVGIAMAPHRLHALVLFLMVNFMYLYVLSPEWVIHGLVWTHLVPRGPEFNPHTASIKLISREDQHTNVYQCC